MAEAGDEFGLDGAVERVIDSLVDDRANPSISIADFHEASHFPGLEVRDSEAVEEPFLVQLVDGAEGVFEAHDAVGAVEVEHVYFFAVQRFQTSAQPQADVFGRVRVVLLWLGHGRGWESFGGGVQLPYVKIGIELGVHNETALLPVYGAQVFFGGAVAVAACRVDLVVAVGLKDVDDFCGFVGAVDTCAAGVYWALVRWLRRERGY